MFFRKAKKIEEQERCIKEAENYIDFLVSRSRELSRRFERLRSVAQETYESVRIGRSASFRRYEGETAEEERAKAEKCRKEVLERLMEELDREDLVVYDRREDVSSSQVRIFGEIIVLAKLQTKEKKEP